MYSKISDAIVLSTGRQTRMLLSIIHLLESVFGILMAFFGYREKKKVVCILGILIAVIGFINNRESVEMPPVELYPTDGIVSPDGTVTLKTSYGCRVFYTLNPNEDPSENGIPYDGPLKIEDSTQLNAKSKLWFRWGPLCTWELQVAPSGSLTSIEGIVQLKAKYTGDAIMVGDDLNQDSFRVRGVLADNTEVDIKDFSIKSDDFTKPGTYNVRIAYGSLETTCKVEVIDLVEIDVVFQGDSVELGETIAKDLFVVNAVYSDGSKRRVYDFDVIPDVLNDGGEQEVTIGYKGFSTTCSIVVNDDFENQAWESHTPDDALTSVNISSWDPDNDYGINGKRYSGGLKIDVSNAFSSWGSTVEQYVESTCFLSVRNTDETDVFEGLIVLDQSMLYTNSHATISIVIDDKEVFTTGDIGSDDQKEYPFTVSFSSIDTIKVVTKAYLIGSDFTFGLLNKD